MALRSVPAQHVPSLAAFLALSDEDVEKLVSALRATTLTLDPYKALKASIGPFIADRDDAKKLSTALFSLYMGVAGSGVTTSSFVEDIIVALEEGASEEIDLAGENREKLKTRLVTVLTTEPLATSTRAVSLQFEHRYTFSKIRVASDIRPVFGESAEEPPKGAIIAHNLNLHYYDGSAHKQFHFALDAKDLQAMINILNRAQAKAEQLESVIRKAELPFIGE